MNFEKTLRPFTGNPVEPTDHGGQVLQWRPRISISRRDGDVDFFEFRHELPAPQTNTAKIFAAERRLLDVRRARSLSIVARSAR